MNWSRGLLRLWMVASVLWICGIFYGWGLLSEWSKLQRMDALIVRLEAHINLNKPFTNAEGQTFTVEKMRDDLSTLQNRRTQAVSRLKEGAWIASVPPVAVVVLAWLASWVASGFRKD